MLRQGFRNCALSSFSFTGLNSCLSIRFYSLYREVLRDNTSPERFNLVSPINEAQMDPASKNLFNRLQSYKNPKDLANLLQVVKNGRTIVPEHITYVMNQLTEVNDIEELKKMIDLWNFKQFSKESTPYTYLIDAYFRAHDREKGIFQAKELWKELTAQGIKPTSFTYECMIFGLLDNGLISDAFEKLEEMKSHNMKPSLMIYELILSNLTSAVKLNEAQQVFNTLITDYGEPSISFYKILLTGYAHAGKFEEIEKVITKLKTSDPEIWSLLIDAHTRATSSSDPSRLTQLVSKLQQETQAYKTPQVLSALLNYYSVNSDIRSAQNILLLMKEHQIIPYAYAYTSLLKYYVDLGDIKRALSVFQETLQQNIITKQLCYIIGKGLANAGAVEQWSGIVELMLEHNITLDLETYHLTILCLLSKGDIDGAWNMLTIMRNDELVPTTETFGLFIHHHCALSEMKEASKVIDVMKREGYEPDNDIYMSLMLGYTKKGDMKSAAPLVKYLSSGDRIEEFMAKQ